MKDKLMVIKEKLVVVKNGAKSFFSKLVAFVKRSFLYIKSLGKLATPFLLIIVVLMAMYMRSEHKLHEKELEDARQDAQIITEYFVAEELKSIGEINTQEYTYTIERSTSDSRKIFNCNVPLTKKSVSVLYSGEVEIGYNIADIGHKTIGKVIFINIPKPIVENHITKEVVKDEDNNIFNPIAADDYAKLREGVLDEGLKKATDKGAYEAAETELKSILKNHFKQFGYDVTFI